jgi:hypothetical protein
MPGSLNQFVLISARKSRGGEWSPDDYDVRDNAGIRILDFDPSPRWPRAIWRIQFFCDNSLEPEIANGGKKFIAVAFSVL